jgi:HPt (histidine-containing phosphotransfer) domain-containing protein
LKKLDRTASDSANSDTQTSDQKLQAMISLVWERSRHTVAERASLLRTAADLLLEGRLDEAARKNAVDSAHKLAGVLGTFGLARGTDLAREAEVFFARSSGASKDEIERVRGMLAELAKLIDDGPEGSPISG